MSFEIDYRGEVPMGREMQLTNPGRITANESQARLTHQLSAWPVFILHASNGTDPDTEHRHTDTRTSTHTYTNRKHLHTHKHTDTLTRKHTDKKKHCDTDLTDHWCTWSPEMQLAYPVQITAK